MLVLYLNYKTLISFFLIFNYNLVLIYFIIIEKLIKVKPTKMFLFYPKINIIKCDCIYL